MVLRVLVAHEEHSGLPRGDPFTHTTGVAIAGRMRAFKAKFKNGTNVEGNLALGMVAAKPDGTLKDGNPTTTTYSKPDLNGWVTVTLKYALSDVQTASFSIATPQTATDTLHIAELYAAKK